MSVHEVPKIPALSILCLTYPALAGAGLLQASPNAISPSWLAWHIGILLNATFGILFVVLFGEALVQMLYQNDAFSLYESYHSPAVRAPPRLSADSEKSKNSAAGCIILAAQQALAKRAQKGLIMTIYDINTSNTDLFGFPVAISTTKPSSNLFMAQFALRQRRSDSQQFRWFSQSPSSALHLRLSESHRFRQQGLCHHKHSLKFVS